MSVQYGQHLVITLHGRCMSRNSFKSKLRSRPPINVQRRSLQCKCDANRQRRSLPLLRGSNVSPVDLASKEQATSALLPVCLQRAQMQKHECSARFAVRHCAAQRALEEVSQLFTRKSVHVSICVDVRLYSPCCCDMGHDSRRPSCFQEQR